MLAYRGRLNNYLLEPLGEVKVRHIDTERVHVLAAELAGAPVDAQADAKYNGVAGDAVDTLKMVLRAAVRDGILTAMPDVATPARKSVRHDDLHMPEDDVATPSQVDALYEADRGQRAPLAIDSGADLGRQPATGAADAVAGRFTLPAEQAVDEPTLGRRVIRRPPACGSGTSPLDGWRC